MATLEICTYRLHPRERDEFVRIMCEQSVLLLRAAGITVLAAGPSLAGGASADEAYLIRAFATEADRQRQHDEFYSSEAWRSGPREGIVSRIESAHTITIDVDDSEFAAISGAFAAR